MATYALIAAALLALLALVTFKQITVFDFERALRYRRGRLAGVLLPGAYWVWPRFTTIVKVDMRPNFIAVPGQEVLSSDGVAVKLSIAANYQVADPEKALSSVVSYQTALYTHLQLALREIISTMPAEGLVTTRNEIGKRLTESTAPKVADFGLQLLEADVKDIMFPGEMKKVFSQIVKARQEGLAALERARGETAALRNLANAAALVEQRPSLMQLRLLQSIGQTPGNTVVLGMGATPNTIPLRPTPEPPAQPLPPAEDADA